MNLAGISAALRWGTILATALLTATGLASLTPAAPTLTATADWINGALAAIGAWIGAGGAVELRLALSGLVFALLALPVSGRMALGGPRWLSAAAAILGGAALSFGLSIGVGGELIRQMRADPGGPVLQEASKVAELGYTAGYLQAADYVIGQTLFALQSWWPTFAAQTARLSDGQLEPLSVVLYASLVCLSALAPIFVLRLAGALCFERILRGGAARLGLAALVCASMIGVAVGLDYAISQAPPPPEA